MNRLPPLAQSNPRSSTWHRVGRALRRLHGVAYAVIAAGAMAAAGLQPPHAAAVEVGTVAVARAAVDELAWPAATPASR